MMGAAEDGRAAGDARFEVAAAEEQERSAEEQESERRADGGQGPRLDIPRTQRWQGTPTPYLL